jgi:hypothetical protein
MELLIGKPRFGRETRWTVVGWPPTDVRDRLALATSAPKTAGVGTRSRIFRLRRSTWFRASTFDLQLPTWALCTIFPARSTTFTRARRRRMTSGWRCAPTRCARPARTAPGAPRGPAVVRAAPKTTPRMAAPRTIWEVVGRVNNLSAGAENGDGKRLSARYHVRRGPSRFRP